MWIMTRDQMIQHGVLWSWDFGNCWYFIGCIMYVEEGVNHGKRTDDKTLCVMAMGWLELLWFPCSSNALWRGCESMIWSCWRSGFGHVDILLVFICILEQTLDHHGFCELEICDFHWLQFWSNLQRPWVTRGESRNRCKQALGGVLPLRLGIKIIAQLAI